MTQQHWALVFACAAVVALVTAALAWRRRGRTPAATALAAAMLGVAAWSAADAVVYSVASDAVRRVFPPVLLASVGLVCVAVYVVARTVVDPSWRLARRSAALLAIEPVVMVVAASVPATRDLVLHLPTVGAAGDDARITLGPIFGLHTAYSYVLVALAYRRLARGWKRATGVFRRQIGVLLGAAALSTAGNVLAVALQADGNGDGVDLTPLCFLFTGLIDSWALLRLGLLRVVPVARDQVVDTVPDAVLVVDPDGRILDLNPAARALLEAFRPDAPADAVGRLLGEVAPHAVAILERTEDRDGHRLAEVRPGRWLDVRSSPVSDPRGRPLGRILVVRDVSDQQARQRAVELLNRQLAEQVAEIERLRAVLAEEAVRDPLTGLHNRRHLDRALDAALAGATDAKPVSLVLVDLDHFKAVNDRFGHAGGDRVLTALGRILQDAVRAGDTAARLGGEEFVLVMAGAGRDRAIERAEQLRRRVRAAVHHLDGDELRVTLSIGVAASPDDGSSGAALLDAADRALYTAKATGRDRVVAASALDPRRALDRHGAVVPPLPVH
ncbi:histidine kinase N-terminal 7TM domain-containing diguanylate cyclase [Trujillonella endophytica]|uniref:Diguanylate cyclase (GGDEF) domain-containing protein n=1 Tax=Trujillonella endophytica TaxID=673521 RepID=A0A1H8PJH4_9ACTN|nr:diguanylate cyclase [Trujillella endophytica]SEO42122.1 diguanylate cyclase (GGDEF) domain-containing protein [Trujillella endophytica]